MRRTAKWILGTAAVLIGLLLVITLTLPLLIDPNAYKERITREISAQTGREVSIPGDIDLKISPLGLQTMFRLGEVSIASTPAFPDTKLLTSRLVEIRLALWPLIRDKELRMDTIRLEGVNLNLIRNEDGTGNWGDVTDAAGKKAAPPSQPAETKPAGGLAGVDIGGVDIKNLNVSFTDKQTGASVRLKDFNLTAGRIRPGNPIPVQGDFAFLKEESGQQPLTVRVNARTDLTFSADLQRLSLQGFSGTSQIAGVSPGVPELGLTLATDLDLDLGKEQVEIKKLQLQKGEVQAEAALSVSGFAAPRVQGTLRIPAFSPRGLAAAWGVTLPLKDQESLSKLAADLEFTYEPTTLTVSRLQLALDDTTVSGTAAARDLNAKPIYDLALHIDRIDLNRYAAAAPEQPAPEPASATPPAAAPKGDGDDPLLPVALLRGLNFKADLSVDSLQSGKLSVRNLKCKAGGKDGAITLAPLAAELYDGSITVNGELDARPDTPTIHLTQSTRGIQLGPLLRDLSGKEEITGRADINADLTSRGLTRRELTGNSNGTMNLTVADGEIAKLQIIDTIRTAKAVINAVGGKGQTPAGTAAAQTGTGPQGAGRPTSFARLSASGVLRNGVFHNDDLEAESELMRVTGKGTVDLTSERIDYLLTIYLAKTIDRNEQTGLVDLADTPIPYRVKGTFAKIEQSAALEEIVKSQAQKVLVKELEKRLGGEKPATTQKESGSTEDLINKGLKSLFGK